MVKICLAMIVKNESKIIKRCLNSLKSIVDYICITDTGSDDSTVQLIKEWGSETGVPTTVFHGPEYKFKDFGYNRTQSYQLAVKTYPDADYVFLCDADMSAIQTPEWPEDRKKLTEDVYNLIQKAGNLEYWNARLLATRLPWECQGVSHEVWHAPNAKHIRLKSLWFDDKNDGGAKADKYTRDKRLLTEGLADPATSEGLKTRYKFYLAQTLKSLNEYKPSIRMYKKRIEAGGWVEEVFYSYYTIGLNYISLKREDKAVQYFLKAYNYRKTRSEPLYELAKLYREKGDHNTAMLFINAGRAIPYPNEDSLFVSKDIYDHLFLFELSVCGFYIGEEGKKQGKIATQVLLSKKDALSSDLYDLTKSNAVHYGIKLEEGTPGPKTPKIEEVTDDKVDTSKTDSKGKRRRKR